jgi:choline-sulfatase
MNVVFILSDQHNAGFSACYGHPLARTPNIDWLAGRGTRFDSAYCASPLCVPARAAMHTGRYAHELSMWDNTKAWNGTPRGWSHYFRDNGVHFATVGHLDFTPGVDYGIAEELLTGHRDSMDVVGLYRDQIVPRNKLHLPLKDIRPRKLTEPPPHDDHVLERSLQWLKHDRPTDRPWILNINLFKPHPNWRPREDLWARYQGMVKDLPAKYWQKRFDLHPSDQAYAIHTCGDAFSEADVLRCHDAYLAVIEELDEQIGQILQTLRDEHLLEETLIIYASDHGELMRAHGAWTKGSMYEDSIRVPLIMAGPGIAKGKVDSACVSHLDLFPTMCEAVGLKPAWDKRGRSLLSGERAPFILSEFHGNGFPNGIFAIRAGPWKLVETVSQRPQLYNLHSDPDEMNDLMATPSPDAAACSKVTELRTMLSSICSPEAVDARAKQDQARLRAELEASGRLIEELAKRGFEPRTDKLVNVTGTTAD